MAKTAKLSFRKQILEKVNEVFNMLALMEWTVNGRKTQERNRLNHRK